MTTRWGNSILAVNFKYIACEYCGIPIKDREWFKIKQLNGRIFAFGEKLCEDIWDKKHGRSQEP